ncbi:unnamed protein product [Phaedon cochleariae]|uniref:Uncharacterized protein n=1 Tax=Phaedon cochleariae TaxID=80249 RepID=A0A9N9X1W6_PHACE|nr:unnamed protein product [Phaedon cochleariae]
MFVEHRAYLRRIGRGGLSDLDVKLRYPIQISHTQIASSNSTSSELTVDDPHLKKNLPDLSHHPLVVGPRYLDEDLTMSWSNHLGWNTSGVLMTKNVTEDSGMFWKQSMEQLEREVCSKKLLEQKEGDGRTFEKVLEPKPV